MGYKKLLLVLLIITGLLITLSFISLRHKGGQAKLNILVAPSGATLKLDGRGIKSGVQSVKPGQHTVSVSKEGFAGQQETVQASLSSTIFVGIVLQPNSADTKDWYEKHDVDLVQSINNQLFDQNSKSAITVNPLTKKLPYVGPGLNYRIDYGVPSSGSKTGQVGIYIRYRTEQDKQNALTWVKDQGFDPSKLDIIYIQGDF